MKTILLAINSKYIHTMLSCRYLKAACKGQDIEVLETNINIPSERLLWSLYEKQPHLIGISCYIFNMEYIDRLIPKIRAILPTAKILLGGWEVSMDSDQYLTTADYIIRGEGERAFRKVVEKESAIWESQDLSDLKDFSRIENDLSTSKRVLVERVFNGDTALVHSEVMGATDRETMSLEDNREVYAEENSAHRELVGQEVVGEVNLVHKAVVIEGEPYECLDDMVSPYDDEYLAFGKERILYYESSRGCPFRCSYCMSSKTQRVRVFSLKRVECDLKTMMLANPMQIKFVDRTFNADITRAKQIIRFILAEFGDKRTNFHFEMVPELFDEELFELFEGAPKGMFQIEVGVQSFNAESLKICHRQVHFDVLMRNIGRLSKIQTIHVHADLIAGLPKEDYQSFARSFDCLYNLSPGCIQLGFLKLLKGSELRENATEFGYRYFPSRPYELIQSDCLSYTDILKLKDIEQCVELYYNSGRFQNGLAVIQAQFESAFVLFEALASALKAKNKLYVPGSAVSQYDEAYAFGCDCGVDPNRLYEALDKDFMESGNVRHWHRNGCV